MMKDIDEASHHIYSYLSLPFPSLTYASYRYSTTTICLHLIMYLIHLIGHWYLALRLVQYLFLSIMYLLILIRYWRLLLKLFHSCYPFQTLHYHSIFIVSQVSMLLTTHSGMITTLDKLNQFSLFFEYKFLPCIWNVSSCSAITILVILFLS